MGGYFWAWTWTWTFTFLYLVNVVRAFAAGAAPDRSLFQDLGLTLLPDVTKINVSQDEYTSMMSAYLDSRREHSISNSIPKLLTFSLARRFRDQTRDTTKLKFPIQPSREEMEVESAQLRFLLPPLLVSEMAPSVRVQVRQILGTRRRRLLEEKLLYLSHNLTKWCEMDVTSAVQSWFNGQRNLGVELVCLDCINSLRPIEAAVSALVYQTEHLRLRRSNSPYHMTRRTDCRESRRGNTKKRCCRHNLTVKFAELIFPEMGSIVQPKSYEAGFCQGQCPPNFNHATNHSRIQSLIHQMDRKNAKRLNRRAIPKACCAPSKLEPLEILRVSPSDGTKLVVEKWDNMQVIECACS